MVSLILLLVLGWLLYKAFFPGVAPYYGKVPTDDDPQLCHRNTRGIGGVCPHGRRPLSRRPAQPTDPLNSLFEDNWKQCQSDNELFGMVVLVLAGLAILVIGYWRLARGRAAEKRLGVPVRSIRAADVGVKVPLTNFKIEKTLISKKYQAKGKPDYITGKRDEFVPIDTNLRS